MPRVLRRKRGEGVEYVTCRLCGRSLLWISPSHLIHAHGWTTPHPQEAYKRRFRVRRMDCFLTWDKRERNSAAALARQGKLWTPGRLRALVRSRLRRRLPVNYEAAARDCPSAPLEAVRFFGSWRGLLEECGLDWGKVVRRRPWTAPAVLAAIDEARRRGEDLSDGASRRRDPGLHDAAISRFGSWDGALRAAGLDPSGIRKYRRWTRDRILDAIRALPGSVRQRAVRAADPSLFNVGRRFFGTWSRAVRAAVSRSPRPPSLRSGSGCIPRGRG